MRSLMSRAIKYLLIFNFSFFLHLLKRYLDRRHQGWYGKLIQRITIAIMSSSNLNNDIVDDLHQQSANLDQKKPDTPENLIIFIRDQVKPEDLWLPRDWAEENLPTRQWLIDNGLSFTNSFTNTAMCSVARSTFFTSKFPAQHQLVRKHYPFKQALID